VAPTTHHHDTENYKGNSYIPQPPLCASSSKLQGNLYFPVHATKRLKRGGKLRAYQVATNVIILAMI